MGPYCPVYGFAITTILIFTRDVQNNLPALFLVGLVVATIFEFFASLILEKAFHMKLWDYSNLWGNLDGRVAPAISLFWAVGTVILVRFIQPSIMAFVTYLQLKTDHWAAIGVAFVMSGDTVITVLNTGQFRQHAAIWEQRVKAENERLHIQLLDAIDQQRLNQQKRRARLAELVHPNWNERRIMHNYPRLKLAEAPHLAELRTQLANYRKDLREKLNRR